MTKVKEFPILVSSRVADMEELLGSLALYICYLDKTTHNADAPDGTYYDIVDNGEAFWARDTAVEETP